MHRCLPALLLCFAAARAQTYEPGPQVVAFVSSVDDSEQPYALYVPAAYDPGRKYPLVVMLHGEGSNHRLDLRRVFGQGNRVGETDAEASRNFPRLKSVDFLVAAPLARGTMGYTGVAERDVYDMLADLKRRFSIDDNRVYLTGLSMGGGGALALGLTRPDIWAAVAPVCPAPPPGLEELAGNALGYPVKLFQGALDPVIDSQGVRNWQGRLTAAGVQSEYVEYAGVRHNAWDHAYKNGAIFDWFSGKLRNRFPNRVSFVTREYRHSGAYWVKVDRLHPGEPAIIDARFAAANKLVISTSGLDAFTLDLRGHPMHAKTGFVAVAIDGKALKVRSQDSLSFSKSSLIAWATKRALPGKTEKQSGQEGPLSSVVASRHIYVYGTGGAPSLEELTRRREQAQLAAEWSSAKSRLLLKFRVVADAELRPEEERSSNLVIFGTAETNLLLAKMQKSLPLRLNPGAADYGLLYVFPVNGRQVAVSSGLPWWTHVDQVPLQSPFQFLPARQRALASFGDFVVFRGGIDNIVAQGRFDREWKLSSDVVSQLLRTQAIEVRQ